MQILERRQARVEKFSFAFEPAAGFFDEIDVFETCQRDLQRRAVDGPRLLMNGEPFDSARIAKQVTEAKTRYAIVLGERAQDDEIRIASNFCLEGFVLDEVDERFVDDHETFPRQSEVSDFYYLRFWNQLTGDAIRRGEENDIAISLPCGQELLQ